MPELDSIRGIAILMVLCFHNIDGRPLLWEHLGPFFKRLALLSTIGRHGVPLFFVLSGFLITGILLQSRDSSIYFRRFYMRRAQRILPAYFAILAALAVWTDATPAYLLLCGLFSANMASLFAIPVAYPPLWSLAVEEHFYLLWPLIVRRVSQRMLAGIALALIIATPVARLLHHRAGQWGVEHFYTWVCIDGLALGALIAVYVRRADVTRHKVRQISLMLMASGLVGLAIGVPFGIGHRSHWVGATFQNTLLNLLFGGFLMLTLYIGSGRHKAWVNRPVLRFFGHISYGLYLVHVLVFPLGDLLIRQVAPHWLQNDPRVFVFLIRLGMGTGVGILIAQLSRKYFEGPILNLKLSPASRTLTVPDAAT